jgi:N-acetyl-anhydromuramoyl-L-alanine amidase
VGLLEIDELGNVPAAVKVWSPNCDERPQGTSVSMLVVHGISLPPGEFGGYAVEALFSNRLDPSGHPYFRDVSELRVSAHFLIGRDGRLVQFVSCNRRAWHAGQSSWLGRDRCNDFSIGVELEGADDVPYAAVQYCVLAALANSLIGRYPISEILGHCDIAPGRKTDPGPALDWRLLRTLMHS